MAFCCAFSVTPTAFHHRRLIAPTVAALHNERADELLLPVVLRAQLGRNGNSYSIAHRFFFFRSMRPWGISEGYDTLHESVMRDVGRAPMVLCLFLFLLPTGIRLVCR